MGRLLNWLLGPSPRAQPIAADLPERFGDREVGIRLGQKALAAGPARGKYRTAIGDLLSAIPGREKEELVDRVLLRFALYVYDLPGSETHHHSRPFGHLDHSLEVAHAVLEDLSGRRVHVSEDPALAEAETPLWTYAAFLGSLLHDIGKVSDLEVRTPDGRDRWQSVREPLAQFLSRNGMSQTPAEYLHFLPGRGLRKHVWQGPLLYALVLHPAALAYGKRQLGSVLEAFLGSTLGELPAHIPPAARKIAQVIRAKDGESTKEELEGKKDGKGTSTPGKPTLALELTPSTLQAPAIVSNALDASAEKTMLQDYFANALRIALDEGKLPLNLPGGLYAGPEYFWLACPEALKIILGVMERKWILEDDEVAALVRSPWPVEGLIEKLADSGRLYSGPEVRVRGRADALVVGPGGEKEFLLVVGVARIGMKLAPPIFEGKIHLGQAKPAQPIPPKGAGDPEGASSNPSSPAAPESRPPESRAPGEILSAKKGPPPPPPTIRPEHRRMERELEAGKLSRALTALIVERSIHRNGRTATVFIQKEFTWGLFPGTFARIAEKLGVSSLPGVAMKIVRALDQKGKLAPPKEGSPLVLIETEPGHPGIRAARFRTESLLTPNQVKELGEWPGVIRIVESSVGPDRAAGAGERG